MPIRPGPFPRVPLALPVRQKGPFMVSLSRNHEYPLRPRSLDTPPTAGTRLLAATSGYFSTLGARFSSDRPLALGPDSVLVR
jgi:hypothetical protein